MSSTTSSTTSSGTSRQTSDDFLPTPPPEPNNAAPTTAAAKTAKPTTTPTGAIVPAPGTFVVEDDEKRLPVVYEGDTVIGPGLLRDAVYDSQMSWWRAAVRRVLVRNLAKESEWIGAMQVSLAAVVDVLAFGVCKPHVLTAIPSLRAIFASAPFRPCRCLSTLRVMSRASLLGSTMVLGADSNAHLRYILCLHVNAGHAYVFYDHAASVFLLRT